MSRRPHPYFGHINRLTETRKAESGKRRGDKPQLKPQDEAGTLWDALRPPPALGADPAGGDADCGGQDA